MLQLILVLLSFLALGAGVLSLTQATMGAGLVGVACYFGILVRIVQARDHQKELKELLAKAK